MFTGLFGTSNVLPCSTSEKKVKEIYHSKAVVKVKPYPQFRICGTCVEHLCQDFTYALYGTI